MKWYSLQWLIAALACRAAAAEPFSYADVCRLAQDLAVQPFQTPSNVLSEDMKRLSYDQMRDIRFRGEKALWVDERLRFKIEFFHLGGLHDDPVTIYEVAGAQVTEVPFSTALFSYPTNRLLTNEIPGFAGFRILTRAGSQEIAAFLDASYFRMVGRGQTYGTSARGLAINTTQIGQEEFPAFRRYWLHKPRPRSAEITVHALLDSPSATGGFEFVIQGGDIVTAKIRATLFLRREVADLGLAPLTSMFWFDENSHEPRKDYRPEVHDSDGLLLHTAAGEWIWRPFEFGTVARFDRFTNGAPRGFGLLQRDRDFDHHFDLEAKYHQRPNVWVTPLSPWGAGKVTLIQLGTQSEFADNIVAYWTPDVLPKPGEPFALSYELQWSTNRIVPETLGQVRMLREGRTGDAVRLVVEFEGGLLRGRWLKDVKAVMGGRTELRTHALVRNDFNGTQRLTLEFTAPTNATEVSAFLESGGRRLTETWNFTWQP